MGGVARSVRLMLVVSFNAFCGRIPGPSTLAILAQVLFEQLFPDFIAVSVERETPAILLRSVIVISLCISATVKAIRSILVFITPQTLAFALYLYYKTGKSKCQAFFYLLLVFLPAAWYSIIRR